MSRAGGRIFAVVVGVTVLTPFVPLLLWSVSGRWFFPDLLPAAWSLRAWEYALGATGGQVLAGLWESVAVAGITAAIAVAVGIGAGRALGLHDFPGKPLVLILMALPVIVPPLCVAMGLHLWFIRLGLAESRLGVVLVHLTACVPYAVFVLWGVFERYDPAFEEQARSLGATPVQVLRRVTIPFILPGVTVAALFAFLVSWTQYLGTLIIGGGRIITLPVLLFALMDSGDRPVAAAVSLIFVAPALGALILSARALSGRATEPEA